MIKLIFFLAIALILFFPLLLALGGALVFGLWRAMTYETRFRKYFAKYDKNDELARMLASGKIWTGQTAEQLKDAKGEPLSVQSIGDQTIWIYKPNPLTRAPLRVVIENDRVQNWSL